ncbi:DUF2274 domain-containing protein [Sphingobium xenophagum]
MSRLKLGPIAQDKPVRMTIELPACKRGLEAADQAACAIGW